MTEQVMLHVQCATSILQRHLSEDRSRLYTLLYMGKSNSLTGAHTLRHLYA